MRVMKGLKEAIRAKHLPIQGSCLYLACMARARRLGQPIWVRKQDQVRKRAVARIRDWCYS